MIVPVRSRGLGGGLSDARQHLQMPSSTLLDLLFLHPPPPFSPCQDCLVEARAVNSQTDTEHVSG